jgi:deoxyguanosine kinase
VYLKADTDVLMKRIAKRDRSYERNMDVNYIDALNQSYDSFFTNCPLDVNLLVIDTDEIDFVQNEDDFEFILDRIRQSLKIGPYQNKLPL